MNDDIRQQLVVSRRLGWLVARYAIAIAIPISIGLLQLLLDRYTAHAPLVMFLLGVFLVAWFAGPGPGLVASFFSIAIGEYAFLPPLAILDRAAMVGLFLLLCAPVLLLTSRLQSLERRAREIGKIREWFLSAASHELRSPLTALTLQLESIGREAKHSTDRHAGRIAERVVKATRSLDRLVRLMDLLMDITRVEAGKLSLDRSKVDLAEVVHEVVTRVLDDPSMSCQVEVRAEAPIIGHWDRARLDQVVTNLISNACKYGDGKPVTVAVAHHNGTARIAVCDQGPGIERGAQSRLFQRLERIASEKKISGTGLGLWLTREIVDAHGGSVRIESDLGKGSTFIVELPSNAA